MGQNQQNMALSNGLEINDRAAPRSSKLIEETVESASKSTVSLAHHLLNQISNLSQTISGKIQWLSKEYVTPPVKYTWYLLSIVLESHPVLRYFLFTFSAFAFIPLSVFSLFVVTSLFGTIVIALSGATIVESVMLIPAATILGLFLMLAAGFTFSVLVGYFMAWAAVATTKVLTAKLNTLFGATGVTLSKNLDAVEDGVQKGWFESNSR